MSDYSKLTDLTELQFIQSQSVFRQILREENKLRADIAKLRSQAEAVDANGMTEMHSVGADILWRAWVARMLTQLNTELAQVLARKENCLAQVQRAFSRMNVTVQLAENDKEQVKAKRNKIALNRAISSDLFRKTNF